MMYIVVMIIQIFKPLGHLEVGGKVHANRSFAFFAHFHKDLDHVHFAQLAEIN